MANVTDWTERLGDRLTEGERYPPPFQQWFFAFFCFISFGIITLSVGRKSSNSSNVTLFLRLF